MAEKFACAICLSFESEVITIDYFVCTKCGHIFHYSCIKSAVDSHAYRKCPVCRKPMSLNSLTRLYGIESPVKAHRSPSTSSCTHIEPIVHILSCHNGCVQGNSSTRDGHSTLSQVNHSASLTDFDSSQAPHAPCDYTFRITVLGGTAVGKTSVLRQFTSREFHEDEHPTTSPYFGHKLLRFGEKCVKLRLNDIDVVSRSPDAAQYFLKSSHAILLMYSVQDGNSFQQIEAAADLVKKFGPEDVMIVVIGNKCDQEEGRVVTTGQGEEIASRLGATFFETSAKDGQNVPAVFQTVVANVVKRWDLAQENKAPQHVPVSRRRSSQGSRFGNDRRCSIV